MIDIPTALTEREAIVLNKLATNKRVLEVGSLLGHSTIAMALSAFQVVSVDPHEGYPFNNPTSTWKEFNSNLNRFGIENVLAYKSDDRILGQIGTGFDLVFIDADGTYDTTRRIMERASLVLKIGGEIVVHDYGIPEWPGAGQAVCDFCIEHSREFLVVDTLAVIV